MPKPTLREAYELLKLQPLQVHLEGTSGDRAVGATTWMLVEAARTLLGREDVIIVAGDLLKAEDLAKRCLDFTLKLQGNRSMATRATSRGPTSRVYSIRDAGDLHWESSQTIQRFFAGRRREDYRVFSDSDFQTMAVQRRDGPFAEIRKLVKQDDGGYAAFTALNEYLFDLTEEGARQVADADPYRVVVED